MRLRSRKLPARARTTSALAFVLALSAGACSLGPAPSRPERRAHALAFVDVQVIPMDRERVLAGQTVVVQDGAIVAVGPRADVPVPEGAEIVAGDGGYLMPGLADMHVHLYDTEGFSSYLAAGFTTVADLIGSPDVLAWREATARGTLTGPTIYSAGPALNGYPPGNPVFVALENPESARRVVAAQKAAGYDFIKVYNTLPEPVYEAILKQAAASHIAVLGHVPWDVGAERVLEGYQSNVAHMEEFVSTYFDERPDEAKIAPLTRAVVASGDYVTPNLFTYSDYLRSVAGLDATLSAPALRYVSPAALSAKLPLNNRSVRPNAAAFAAALREGHAIFQKLTKAFFDAGVPLMLGTDTEMFGQAGLAGLSELDELVAAGLTPYQALATATRVPGEYIAKHVRAGERFGTVAPGGRADLLLLAKNPLEGVRNMRSLRGLALRGRYLPAAELTRAHEATAAKNEPLQRGVRAIEAMVAAKTYREAAARLRELIAAHPGARVEALLVLFDYAERASAASPADALPFLEVAVGLYPSSPAAHMMLGLALARSGNDAGALEHFERARTLSPDDVRVARFFERRTWRDKPPLFEPAGAYAFTSWVDRGSHRRDVTGTLRIRREGAGYAGTLATNLGPELPLTEVLASGNSLWARALAPDGDELEISIDVEGTALHGRFMAGFGNNRPLAGRRLAERQR